MLSGRCSQPFSPNYALDNLQPAHIRSADLMIGRWNIKQGCCEATPEHLGGKKMTVEEEQLRQRAYSIWEQEGRPHGRDLDHRLRAEAEIAAEKSRDRRTAATETAEISARSSGVMVEQFPG